LLLLFDVIIDNLIRMKHRGINDDMITELCNWIILNKDKIDTL